MTNAEAKQREGAPIQHRSVKSPPETFSFNLRIQTYRRPFAFTSQLHDQAQNQIPTSGDSQLKHCWYEGCVPNVFSPSSHDLRWNFIVGNIPYLFCPPSTPSCVIGSSIYIISWHMFMRSRTQTERRSKWSHFRVLNFHGPTRWKWMYVMGIDPTTPTMLK